MSDNVIQFYSPDIEETHLLPEDESAHCSRVLRHQAGDEIYIVDGKGFRYKCLISEISKKNVRVEILEKISVPDHWTGRITVAVAPTKNADRMEWFAEKAVETGISEIILLKCDRSERKIYKTDRLHKIMVSAMKQSMKARLPILDGPIPFNDFIKRFDRGDTRGYIGYCSENIAKRVFAEEAASQSDKSDIVLLIGPEGDFSEEEIKYALTQGFTPVTFGETRLRTETAALFGLVQIHTVKQINYE